MSSPQVEGEQCQHGLASTKRSCQDSHLWANTKPSEVGGKFPSTKLIWSPSVPNPGSTTAGIIALAPATAPKPGLLRDPRAHRQASRPKVPVTLGGARTEGRCSIPLAVHTARFPDKGPCRPPPQARHREVAGLPMADRQLPLPSSEKKKQIKKKTPHRTEEGKGRWGRG